MQARANMNAALTRPFLQRCVMHGVAMAHLFLSIILVSFHLQPKTHVDLAETQEVQELHLIRGGTVVEVVPTYRGGGRCFV